MSEKKGLFAVGAGTVIGMVHCLPLPGTAGYSGNPCSITKQAVGDAKVLELAGADAIIVENMGDSPFAETLGMEQACMLAAVAAEVKRAVKIPVGIDAAFNDYKAALAIALAVGGMFIRVPVFVDTVVFSDGIIYPCARQCLAYRRTLGAEHIMILADIQVKHTFMLVSGITPEHSARMAADCGADALLVSGSQTGEETPLELVKRVKRAVSLPVLAASGVTAQNVEEQLAFADGAIIGSSLKLGGLLSNPVSPELARELLDRVKRRRTDK